MKGGAGSAATSFLVGLLLLPFVLGHLGRDSYGTWLALSALVAVAALADGGIRTEVARRVAAANGADDSEALLRVVHQGAAVTFLLALPVATAALVFAPAICDVVLSSGAGEGEVTLFRGLVLVMAVNVVIGTHLAALQGIQRSDADYVGQIAALTVNAAITVTGVLVGWGIWALFWGYATGLLTTWTVQWAYARKLLRDLRFRIVFPGPTVALSYLSLSGLALITQVGDVIDSQWDKLVLAHFVGADAVTSFHVGTSLALQAKALAVLPIAPIMVAVAELRGRQQARARDLQAALMKAGAIASGVLLGAVFLFAPAFIDLWLGTSYGDAGEVARVFVVAVALNLVAAPVAFQAFAEGLHRWCALSALTNMTANVVFSLLLTLKFGLLGAAFGSVVGNLIGLAVFFLVIRSRLAYWPGVPLRALALAAATSSVAIALRIDHPGSWWSLITAGALFATGMAVCGAVVERISPSEVRIAVLMGRGAPPG
jgi:O-antigen/teichoic acid export membrane protein